MEKKLTLKVLRAMNDLNQEEMAKRLGICRSYYNQIESRKRPLTSGVLLKICKEFGIGIDDLEY